MQAGRQAGRQEDRWTGGRRDRHDEGNSNYLQLCENDKRGKKYSIWRLRYQFHLLKSDVTARSIKEKYLISDIYYPLLHLPRLTKFHALSYFPANIY